MKQVIILRKDLNMRKGKMIAQGAHASLGALDTVDIEIHIVWKKFGMKKIVVSVDSEEELNELYEKAGVKSIPAYRVHDYGLTELEPGTITALALGPWDDDELNKLTGELKLL